MKYTNSNFICITKSSKIKSGGGKPADHSVAPSEPGSATTDPSVPANSEAAIEGGTSLLVVEPNKLKGILKRPGEIRLV